MQLSIQVGISARFIEFNLSIEAIKWTTIDAKMPSTVKKTSGVPIKEHTNEYLPEHSVDRPAALSLRYASFATKAKPGWMNSKTRHAIAIVAMAPNKLGIVDSPSAGTKMFWISSSDSYPMPQHSSLKF